MHEGAGEDAFTSAVAKVAEDATGVVESVVPAVRVLVLPRLLDPLEDLEERLELDLSIGQVDVFEAAFVTFSPASKLFTQKNKSETG